MKRRSAISPPATARPARVIFGPIAGPVGDEGGIFCAGLMVQKQGEDYAKGKGNIPDLPLFTVAPLSPEEKKLYTTYLTEKAFRGPVFPARPASTGSLLDALKRP